MADRSSINITEIEKENLETHVELSVLRYQALEHRISVTEQKVNSIIEKIDNSQATISKVIIGSSATVLAGLLSTVVTILLKF